MADFQVVLPSRFEESKKKLFESESWHHSDLGFKQSEIQSDRYSLKFGKFRLSWMCNLVKEAIWRKRNSVSYNTLLQYIKASTSLDNYLYSEFGMGFQLRDFNRPCMEAYLSFMSEKSPATRKNYLGCNNELIESWKEWGLFPNDKRLIFRDDLKGVRLKKHTRHLSAYVQSQIDQSDGEIPVTIERMLTVVKEVGLRVGELTNLKKKCLSQDKEGDWYLTRFNFKFKEEHTVPVTKSVVRAIKKQLEETNRLERVTQIPNDDEYLFVHHWRGQLRPYTARNINQTLKKLGKAIDLKDEMGTEQSVSMHQFRHTVGTNLINAGLSQLFVQKYLGHHSAEMTARYAEIHDSTLKKAITEIRGKLVDVKGNLYEAADFFSETEIIEDWDVPIEAKWLQRHLSAQSLPNGICALPVRQTCPHANACLTCPSFRTDITFIAVHREQLSRCQIIIREGEQRNMTRQVELNKRIASNIETIIATLEQDSND